jgi:Na+-translocating ferredoxin:NAD+ oxidoreductase RnfD subunit
MIGEMSAPALAAAGRPALRIRGASYPVLLPTVSDPRLHLAAVIVSLQVLGQAAFGFRLSIAQILVSLATCAALEVGIAVWRERVIMWPASALLTGNGVAFVLRVPGTEHGDWWSLRGWWIFAGTAALSLLSKHVVRVGGRHVFNPSNIGLVVCFLALGSGRAEPLDFWWGPMSFWMGLALAIIVSGGLAILSRLHLLQIAVGFWVAFAAGIAVLAATDHAMTARWHLGPITGTHFWWVLVSSPEILVFLFFMITDPKTIPASPRARLAYAVSIGLLAALLIAPARTEFWSKVAVLGSLAIVCAARPLLERVRPALHLGVRKLAPAGVAALAAYAALLVVAGLPARSGAAAAAPLAATGRLPQISVAPSKGVQSRLGVATARRIAADLVGDLRLQAAALLRRDGRSMRRAAIGDRLGELRAQAGRAGEIVVPTYSLERMRVWLEAGSGQGPAIAVAELDGMRQLTSWDGLPPKVVRRERPASSRTSRRRSASTSGRTPSGPASPLTCRR